MTRPGPPRAIACPHCRAAARVPNFASISFMGSCLWSDGFGESIPSLGPTIIECARCNRCFRDVDALPAPAPKPDLDWISEPSEEAYYAAINRGDFSAAPDVIACR